MNKKNILKIWFDKTFKKVVKVDNIDKIKQLMKEKQVVLKDLQESYYESKGELKIEDLSEIKNDELEAIDTEGNNNYDEKENKYILVTLDRIDYVIGFPGEEMMFRNYNIIS